MVRVITFKVLGDDKWTPPTFQQEMRCRMVFDVKMEDFQRKARLAAGGHMTEVSSDTMTCASVVSMESVRIKLTLAALSDLEDKAADIKNTYLTAPNGEKSGERLAQSSAKTHSTSTNQHERLSATTSPTLCAALDENPARRIMTFGSNPKPERATGTNILRIVSSTWMTF